jgi:hypothetical protein
MLVFYRTSIPDPTIAFDIPEEAFATVYEEPLPDGYTAPGELISSWLNLGNGKFEVVMWSEVCGESDLRGICDRVVRRWRCECDAWNSLTLPAPPKQGCPSDGNGPATASLTRTGGGWPAEDPDAEIQTTTPPTMVDQGLV